MANVHVKQLTQKESLAQIKDLMRWLKAWKAFSYVYWTQCYLYNINGVKVGTLERPTHMIDITRSDARVTIQCKDPSYRFSLGRIIVYSNYPTYDEESDNWTTINEHRFYEE